MIELSPAGRAGTPDEVGTVGALLMGNDGAFITGSDFLMDGGVTASYFYGELATSSARRPLRPTAPPTRPTASPDRPLRPVGQLLIRYCPGPSGYEHAAGVRRSPW